MYQRFHAFLNQNITMKDLQTVDLSKELPDLSKAKKSDFTIGMEYWNPEKEGENIRAFFAGFDTIRVPDLNDKEIIVDLRVARFVYQIDGKKHMICNGSARLVSNLENHDIVTVGTPMEIIFLGKKKNKSNNFSSDTFEITLLHV